MGLVDMIAPTALKVIEHQPAGIGFHSDQAGRASELPHGARLCGTRNPYHFALVLSSSIAACARTRSWTFRGRLWTGHSGKDKQSPITANLCATSFKSGFREVCCGFRTLWDFSRPHTLIGTILSIPMLQLFAAAPVLAEKGSALYSDLAASMLAATIPALLVNIYITGLNQIFDAEIDMVNKPYLPIAAGRLSMNAAWCIVISCLALAFLMASSYPSMVSSPVLHFTLAASAALGTAYSAPPVRLKRSPFLAALSIIVVRGLVINLGFYCYTQQVFCGVDGLCIDFRSGIASCFFAVFGLVIALLKDVPDILGDRLNGVRSLAVRVGPAQVLALASTLLRLLLVMTGIAFGVGAVVAVVCGRGDLCSVPVTLSRAFLALAASLGCWYIWRNQQGVTAHEPAAVYAFYMRIWHVFYASYLCLPLVR